MRIRSFHAAPKLSAALVFPALAASLLLPGGSSPAYAAARPGCPAAESLVPGTTWHRHTIATGVSLMEGQRKDSRGYVDLHVLKVNLAAKHVGVGPLAHSLAERLPLTTLAAGHRRLVAAINTGFFDFITGAPTGPLVVKGFPIVMSKHKQEVVGIDAEHRAESGTVRLKVAAYTKHKHYQVSEINELGAPVGLSVYTPKWGAHSVDLGGGTSREVSAAGRTSSLGRYRHVPSNGYLLIAKGPAAKHWLAGIGANTAIGLGGGVVTSAAHKFVQAYGTGVEIVHQPGHVRTGYTCDSSNTKQPARTAIGYADGGKQLILVAVAEHPGTIWHGLDKDQMSKLLVQLGATHAFVMDGSGSTEMLAKMPGTSSLSIRNYPADGVQRPMSLGLGIYASR